MCHFEGAFPGPGDVLARAGIEAPDVRGVGKVEPSRTRCSRAELTRSQDVILWWKF